MAAVWFRARAELRRDWRTVVIFAVIFGVVGGASLAAAAAPGCGAARLRPAEILRAE